MLGDMPILKRGLVDTKFDGEVKHEAMFARRPEGKRHRLGIAFGVRVYLAPHIFAWTFTHLLRNTEYFSTQLFNSGRP